MQIVQAVALRGDRTEVGGGAGLLVAARPAWAGVRTADGVRALPDAVREARTLRLRDIHAGDRRLERLLVAAGAGRIARIGIAVGVGTLPDSVVLVRAVGLR